MNLITNRTARVLIVDQTESRRIESLHVLKSLGFKEVQTAKDLNLAKREILLGKVDWLLTVPRTSADIDVLQILRLALSDLKWANFRVSLFADEAEQVIIPEASSLGLLSWYPANFNRTSLAQEIQETLGIADRCGGDCSLVAAEYLRRLLRAKQNWKSLTSLSEELIERHFGKPELLIHLAEARFLSGRVDEGISILRQARFFDRSLESQALSMLDNYGFSSIEEESIGGEDDRKEKIHFKNCVLVEPDQIAARSVEETLKSIGISDIQIFSDGESAWDWLKTNPEPQLLVQEWRIPKLSGPALLQRVRSHGHLNTVVIVLSSLVKASDAPLLSEMSVANCFAKPVVPNDFINTLVWTSVQERLPTDAKAIERKLLTLLRTGQISAAKSLKATYFSLPDTSEGERKYIDAEILYYDGKFNEAKTKAVESIRLIGKGSLAPLNLLAKCLLRQKDFKSAFRILEQARKMSPENLGRILDLAELNLHNGDANAAMELVADARRIDSTNSRIDSIEVRGSIAQGKPSRALSLMRSMSSLVEVVSYMNNRAVALAQTGHMKEALDVYRNTLQAVPDDRKSTKTIVGYNLGLCLCRSGDVAGGIEVLEKVAAEIAEPMAERASSLVERLRRAVATGTKVQFSSSLQSSLDGENDITIDFESINKDSVKESAPERETESFVNPICLAGIFRLQ